MCMRVARYHRVSTERQSLQRQVDATEEYIEQHFPDAEVDTFTDASTGTDTAREEYLELIDSVKDGDYDVVVIKAISRISRSIRDLDKTVNKLKDNGAALHIIDESLRITPDSDDPMENAMWQLLGVFAEFEAEMTKKRIKEGIAARRDNEEYYHGPAPLGFNKNDGSLIENDRYDKIVAILEMVIKKQLSKRRAAKELDTSRRTINRAIQERPDLYGLDGVEPQEKEGRFDQEQMMKRITTLERKVADND